MGIALDAIGLIGVALLLLSYLLLQRGALKPQRIVYLLMNLLGASLILVSLVDDWNLAAFVVEASWASSSLYGIAKTINREGDSKRNWGVMRETPNAFHRAPMPEPIPDTFENVIKAIVRTPPLKAKRG